MSIRYSHSSLMQFSSGLFQAAGLEVDRARTMASVFLEADLLGLTTHGMNRVASNLGWLKKGESRAEGDHVVLADNGNLFNWDANFLPGPWIVTKAIEQCMDRVASRGIVCATIRRSQHIAALGAYCPQIAEAGYLALLTCSSPNESNISAFGGIDPLFSANPVAFVAPGDDYPVLFDISMCITAGGYVSRALREGTRLPGKYLKDHQGEVSDDPAVFFADPPGSIMPIGGISHGYKGYALTLMTEILSAALGGYGRANDSAATDGEANSVFIQLIDPNAFGSIDDFKAQTRKIQSMCEASATRPGDDPVRVPGQRAWQRRLDQLENGVELYPTIIEDLKPWAEDFGVEMPGVLSE